MFDQMPPPHFCLNVVCKNEGGGWHVFENLRYIELSLLLKLFPSINVCTKKHMSLCWWRVVHINDLVPPKHCPGVHMRPPMCHVLMFHEVNDSKQSKGGASYHVIHCMVCAGVCTYPPRLPTVVWNIDCQ